MILCNIEAINLYSYVVIRYNERLRNKEMMKALHTRRKGVSELISITILILIAVSVGVALYYAGKAAIDASTYRFEEMAKVAEASMNKYLIVDAYYITSNKTIIIYLYTKDLGNAVFNALYVNGSKVPDDNLVYGFNQPIKIGEINRLSALVDLSTSGPYDILLTGHQGVRAEGVFYLQVG